MMNALMPGDDNWMRSQPMPGQGAPTAEPAKKRNPLMNALSSVFEFGAPEAFEQGRQKRITRDVGNALAGGDYAGAANTYLKGGNIEQGLAVRGMGRVRGAAKRQQEATSVLSLFSQMPALQINEYAMSDPANFERMTGMTSEEYLQAAQRSGDPEKFREYVIQKAQAELGQMPATPEPYTLAPGARRFGPNGEMIAENPVAEKPVAPSYKQITTADGIYEYIEGQPDSMTFLGKAPPTSSGGGGAGDYGLTPVYGRDAEGRRVLLQTSKSGDPRMAPLPDGVTLEDDQFKAYGRTTGTEQAKKDMYQTTAGVGVLAAEEGFARVSEQIDQAIKMSNGNNTGMLMGNAPAPNLDGLLETIGANTAFESLVSLKAQGGTLGALSDAELGLLMSKVSNLKRSQSQDQLDANLEILKIAMQNSMMRIKQAYETEYSSGAYGRPTPATAAPSAPVGPSGQPVPEGFE